MKRKPYIKLIALVGLVVGLLSCQKIDITQIYIVFWNNLPIYENEEIKFQVREYAESDDEKVSPKKYVWTVSDSLGKIIEDDFPDAKEIIWSANKAGRYIVGVEVQYSRNTAKSTSREIHIEIDKRLPYTGDYHFMKVTDHWTENTGHNRDTTYYDGFIKPDPDDKDSIIIKCGEGILANIYNEYSSQELWYRAGSEHPWFGRLGDHSYFNGYFVTTDSVKITCIHGGLGGGTTWTYSGLKIK